MLIEFDKVSKIYKMGSDEIRALDKVDLTIDEVRVHCNIRSIRFGKIYIAKFARRNG